MIDLILISICLKVTKVIMHIFLHICLIVYAGLADYQKEQDIEVESAAIKRYDTF